MMNDEPLWAVVPAAGNSARLPGALPKQYRELAGKPMLQQTLESMLAVPGIDGVVAVLHSDDACWADLSLPDAQSIHTVDGGESRAESVFNGVARVRELAGDEAWVLVHDAAHPLTAQSDIKRLLDAVTNSGAIGGLLGVPVADTLKRADDYCLVEQTVARAGLWQAQTPQLFRAGELGDALRSAAAMNSPGEGAARGAADVSANAEKMTITPALSVTDEAAAMELAGHQALLVESLEPNLKITRPADLQLAAALLRTRH